MHPPCPLAGNTPHPPAIMSGRCAHALPATPLCPHTPSHPTVPTHAQPTHRPHPQDVAPTPGAAPHSSSTSLSNMHEPEQERAGGGGSSTDGSKQPSHAHTGSGVAEAGEQGGGGGDLGARRAYKARFQEGVALFNVKPKKGGWPWPLLCGVSSGVELRRTCRSASLSPVGSGVWGGSVWVRALWSGHAQNL